jgi:hypothetical protein
MIWLILFSSCLNLPSISRLDDNGLASIFCDGLSIIRKADLQKVLDAIKPLTIFTGHREGPLYKVTLDLAPMTSSSTTISNPNPISFLSKTNTRSLQDWHLATNHLNMADITKMSSMVSDMKLTNKTLFDSRACLVGKAKASPHPPSNHPVTRIGEIISGDWIESLSPGVLFHFISSIGSLVSHFHTN